MIKTDPNHQTDYEANYKAFIQEIDTLDADIKKIFAGKQGVQFMVFHPSWGYFAREYGLKQVAIEMEGKEPKPAQLLELIDFARKNGIRVIFVQRQFSAKKARVVAREIGGRVVVVDPLAENWFDNLRFVAESIHAVIK